MKPHNNRRPVGDLSGEKRKYIAIQRFDFSDLPGRITNASTPSGSYVPPRDLQRNDGHKHLKSRGMSV